MSTFVLPLADPHATLETVGGKGMSLAKMAVAGLPVPTGFHVTTEAYRRFVADNGLQEKILYALRDIDPTDLPRLETTSRQIRAMFTEGTTPPDIAAEIVEAYSEIFEFDAIPVAVRSSSTAEDLPSASFAGQQETYLNICGVEAVLEAVKKCWASIWTARAVAYRARQGIAPELVTLAVVVQELVCADASGVMFTADPVSGRRDALMITSTWGLGEAIVGGMVTPDTLVVKKSDRTVISCVTSEKLVMTVRTETGTREQPVPDNLRKSPVLNDAQAAELAGLGMAIEQLYGSPMDIEWTLANHKFAVVQARPITSLKEPALEETPFDEADLKWERTNSKALLARGSFAEFVPDPVSPLFATLAVPIACAKTQTLMKAFTGSKGEDAYVFEIVNGYVYVGIAMTPKLVTKVILLSISQSIKFLKSGKARWAVVRAKSCALAEKWHREPGDLVAIPATQLVAGVREIFSAVAEYYTVAQSGPIGAAPMSEIIFGRFYKALVKGKQDPEVPVFLLGAETIPLRAEKSLYDLSMWVKGQPHLAKTILQSPTQEICTALGSSPGPAPFTGEFSRRFAAHLAQFGHTLYDLDFAKPVPADDPAPILETMKAYLSGKGISPYERQRAQVERREQAEDVISRRLDPLRRKWFRKLLHWAQECSPDREDCIADIGLGYPQLRALSGELGRRLAAGGAISQADDIYWLEAREVDAMASALDAGTALTSHADKVEQRRAFWRQVRRSSPPATIPEKSFMSKLMVHDNAEGRILKGYGAGAGKVTAQACVLRGPEEFSTMRPGDVIVAVTTTPAWTPLFALASAVVTDIGGPLSHSSIVAREYGIPAVMATGVASKRIKNGQMITVDGSAGTVTLEG